MVQPVKQNKVKGALERIDALEETLRAVIDSVNTLVNQTNQRLNANAEVINALAHLAGGQEKVGVALEEVRAIRDAEQKARAEKYVKDQVEAGKLVAVEVASPASLIVGVEYDGELKALPPGRIQLPMDNIVPEIREQILGKPAGTRIDTPANTVFEVLEIYDTVTPPVSDTKAEEDAEEDLNALVAQSTEVPAEATAST